MKNKKLLYVLIPGVIGVWGIIIYRIVGGFGGNENDSFQKIEMSETLPDAIANDTFSIHPHYRDPFSGKQIKKAVVSPVPQKVTKAATPVITANWPLITYGGIVKNQKSNKQLVLVQINGQSSIMKAGEIANNIQIITVYKDSIEVKFGKEKRFIKK